MMSAYPHLDDDGATAARSAFAGDAELSRGGAARPLGGASSTALADDEAIARALQDEELREASRAQQRQQPQQPTVVPVARVVAGAPPPDQAQAQAQLAAAELSIHKLERSIRLGFVRKVLGYVVLQLLTVLCVVVLFLFDPAINAACQPYQPNGEPNPSASGILLGVGLAMLFSILLVSCLAVHFTRFPNSLFLALWVAVAVGAFAGVWAVWVNDNALVLFTFLGAIGVMVVLVFFAWQTRFDFTGLGPYLAVASLTVLVFAILGGLWGGFGFFWAGLVCMLLCLYVVYDVQAIVGGKNRRFAYHVDSAPLAAVAIFTDFVLIWAILLGMGAGCGEGV